MSVWPNLRRASEFHENRRWVEYFPRWPAALSACLLAAVVSCVAEKHLPNSRRHEVARGLLGNMGLYVYLEAGAHSYVMTLVLTRGFLPEDHPFLQAEDFKAELLTRGGKPLVVVKKPLSGPLFEIGGPGISVSIVYEFAKTVTPEQLGEAVVAYKKEHLVLPIK